MGAEVMARTHADATTSVTPANAGVSSLERMSRRLETPAFAGVTKMGAGVANVGAGVAKVGAGVARMSAGVTWSKAEKNR
jgi:hypothetical protein